MLTLSRTKTWAFRVAGIAILAHMTTFVMAAHLNADLYRLPLAARAGKVVPNQNCVNDSNCASGHCLPGYDLRCDLLNPDGSPAPCNGFDNSPYGFDDYYAYCAGFPLNHTCANQGECRSGFCNSNGICVKTTVGQACKDDLGCSGSQICKNSTCFTPAAGSLYPKASCKVGSSCKSGQCVTSLGNDNTEHGQKYNSQPVCDYLSTGQKGCRTIDDCQTGQCQNGTCRLGVDGTRCKYNFECAGLCGLDAVCFTPTAPLAPKQPCKNDTQCLSNRCLGPYDYPYYTISRPDYTNSSKTVSAYYDRSCATSKFGGKCKSSQDCLQGNCVSGICTGKPRNSLCFADKDCTSLTCNLGICSASTRDVPPNTAKVQTRVENVGGLAIVR
ncbi:hypothetical protein OC861_000777 [Tilletia horrida]|nr:hypothetical protein OC845_000504 [Tilletia horrida]KAK0569597.1 hypothetical protein OC861_000777 [Tilletia horrida]